MISTGIIHKIYSDLIDSILDSKQFVFKLVCYCKAKSEGTGKTPVQYCLQNVFTTENVTLTVRSDGKLWTFRKDFAQLFLDIKTLNKVGLQAVVMCKNLISTHDRIDQYNNLVYIDGWQQVEFFEQTLIKCATERIQSLFDSMK